MRRLGIGRSFAAGIVALVVVAALVGVFVATGPLSKTSAPATSSSQAPGSSAEAAGPVTILVSRTTLDQTAADAPAGHSLYIYDVTVTDNSTADQGSGSAYFALAGEGTSTYSPTNATSIQDALASVTLSSGQRATGEIAFSVPDSDQPTKLEYSDTSTGIQEAVTSLPAPSRWVSTVSGVMASLPTNADASNYFVSASLVNSTGTVYYSGGKISIQVEITPYNSDDIVDEAVPDITVTSISVANQGFAIASVSPSLPITVSANGNTATTDITVYVTPPSQSVSVGSLSLSLSTS